MPLCECGKQLGSIYCPLCETKVTTDQCPTCTLQKHIQADHPTCTVLSFINAIKARANDSVTTQEEIADKIQQLKQYLNMGRDYILDVYQDIESTFQFLKLRWFSQKNEAARKSITSLYNILEKQIVFSLLAANVAINFDEAFKLSLSLSHVWSLPDIFYKLARPGNGCIIRNINAEAYALTTGKLKSSRKTRRLLKKIVPTLYAYNLGMWPLVLIVGAQFTYAKSSDSVMPTNESLSLSTLQSAPQAQPISAEIPSNSSNNAINIVFERQKSSILESRLNNMLKTNTSRICTSNFDIAHILDVKEGDSLPDYLKARDPPHTCSGYFMVYTDLTMNDTTSLIGALMSEADSQKHVRYDPIYQLCEGEISWSYRTIATIVLNITAGIATTLCDLIVLGSLRTAQLTVLKNVRVHNLVADCPSLIERCYIRNGACICGNTNLFIADAVFGEEGTQNNFDHDVSVIRFSIFEGEYTQIENVKLVANCVFTGPTQLLGQGIYISCYFAHLTLDENFAGQCLNCYIVKLITKPFFTILPLMFHECAGPGLLGITVPLEGETDHKLSKSPIDCIYPEDIDLEFLLNTKPNMCTRLIERSMAAERMDNALESILSREYTGIITPASGIISANRGLRVATDINLSVTDSSSLIDEEDSSKNLLEKIEHE